MASSVRNQGIIITSRRKTPRANTMIFIRKTGYANVWIGDQHIYWNYNVSQKDPEKVDFDKLVEEQAEKTTKTKKQIVIRRR